MQKKRKIGIVCLSVFTLIFFTSLSIIAAEQGGTLTFGMVGDAINLDAPNYSSGPDEEVIRMVYENLVRFKEQSGSLELEPGLATDWSNSPDGLTWTFNLRKGIKFHDGTPFNADAVVYYFKRAIGEPKTRKGWGLFGKIVKSAEAIDPFTVKVNLKTPHAFFLNRIAHGAAAIGSPAAHKKYGKELAFNPVGTGPFVFKEWIKGDHITLVANEDYWRGRPKLDTVLCKPVKESGTRILQLEAGQIDVTEYIPDESIARLEKNKDVDVVTMLSNQGVRLSLNNSKKPFSNVLVRQALNFAVDKETIAKHLYGDLAVVIPGAVSPAIAGFVKMRGYGYDPERARALLSEAGYPNGFSMSLYTTGTGFIMKDIALAETIQKYFSEVGVKVKIEKMEWAAIKRVTKQPPDKNKSDSFFMKWPPSTGEATWMLQASLTKALWPPVGSTRSFYDNPVFDELLNMATSSADVKKRDAYLRAAQIVMNEDAPFVFLVTPMLIWGKSKKVNDMVFSPLSLAFASEKTWIQK